MESIKLEPRVTEDVPIFKQDDPKLKTILTDGIDGKVVILGFPYDEGVLRNGGRRGAELGPDCLRRFIPKTGPIVNCELGIDLSDFTISDYGNIESSDFEACHDKLRTKVLTILNKPHKPIPFIIGGGNDQSWSNGLAFLSHCASNSYKPLIINIDSHLDVRTLDDNNRLHSGCSFRLLTNDFIYKSIQGSLIEFSAQGSQCASAHVKYVEDNNGKIIWMREIRRLRVIERNGIQDSVTQAGQAFEEILKGLKENEKVFVSFDVNSISCAYCPGVSSPSVDGGLTAEEALEIAFLAGKCEKVIIFDLSEYNPAVEDFKTGKLLSNIFYYFCLGCRLRGC